MTPRAPKIAFTRQRCVVLCCYRMCSSRQLRSARRPFCFFFFVLYEASGYYAVSSRFYGTTLCSANQSQLEKVLAPNEKASCVRVQHFKKPHYAKASFYGIYMAVDPQPRTTAKRLLLAYIGCSRCCAAHRRTQPQRCCDNFAMPNLTNVHFAAQFARNTPGNLPDHTERLALSMQRAMHARRAAEYFRFSCV